MQPIESGSRMDISTAASISPCFMAGAKWRRALELQQLPAIIPGRSLQLLLVNAVAVIDLGAGQLGDRQHSLVVLQDPAELAVRGAELGHRVAPRELDQH